MPHLIGETVMLREFRKEDLPGMRAWCNDPEISCYLSDTFLYPHTQNGTEALLNSLLDGTAEHKGFVIADRQTEQYIGQIDLFHIDWKNRWADLGIVIGDEKLHGRGIGAEALQLLIRFVFMELNLHRIQLEAYAFNEKAIRCFSKCGFREEGRLREKHYAKGRYSDVLVMAVLRDQLRAEAQAEI